MRAIPELLSPAGSIDAVRAAVANGADAVYLGASRFNARDEGAQLTLDELSVACRLAHAHQVRIYLTLNVLIKPEELVDALDFLGDAINRGINAVIVQDIGLVRLIRLVYPELEIHGSTQMTVHDPDGARAIARLGVSRVVLARENTLDDLRAIRAAVPDLGLETFIHGALCIAYSGQCLMSGMISDRSANRGSCAQSCRKDYVLTDANSGAELDRGYLISARDLAAHEHLPEIAEAGIVCLKIEGRKKRPEYVATVTRAYRDALDTLGDGKPRSMPVIADPEPLVQIFSRGFTGGMYGGRVGREYVTRDQPDNRGVDVGVVVRGDRGELVIDVTREIAAGDGLGFHAPDSRGGPTEGFTVSRIRTLSSRDGFRQAVESRVHVPAGWRVVRTAHAALLDGARESFADTRVPDGPRVRLDVRVFGVTGSPLKAIFSDGRESVTVQSEVTLQPSTRRPLDPAVLREQFSRLGQTTFVLGDIDTSGLSDGLFLPLSELNHLRQSATEELERRAGWDTDARSAERLSRIEAAIADLPADRPPAPDRSAMEEPLLLAASVFTIDDAQQAADAGATEIDFDPFLRHPSPPLSRVRALAESLASRGIAFRLRTPTIVRPEDRRAAAKWLDAGFALLSGHLGLINEAAARGVDVAADYAVNVFNQHTASEIFAQGASRVVLSVELTTRELAAVVKPWSGRRFDVVVYGRPEGMILEHCVLSAAFDRQVTTCRDLCVQKHVNVTLTDPSGYSFPVATDSACRNRLLHSRPIDATEFLPDLWKSGIRGYRLLFNVPGEPVGAVVAAFRRSLDTVAAGGTPTRADTRAIVGDDFTRGHFARAV